MGRWTAQEKTELVREYLLVRHGQKGPWLAERGISADVMSSWRRAYLFGDLERGLVPRDTSLVDIHASARLQKLEEQLAAERAAREAERQRHDAEVARLQAVNDALGKAIGLLHDRADEQEPTDEP